MRNCMALLFNCFKAKFEVISGDVSTLSDHDPFDLKGPRSGQTLGRIKIWPEKGTSLVDRVEFQHGHERDQECDLELDVLLDQQHSVTFRWYAQQFDVPATQAKTALQEFVDNHDAVHAVYLLGGNVKGESGSRCA